MCIRDSDYNVGRPTRSGLPSAHARGHPGVALVNVFLRPFPWEAPPVLSMVASLEPAVLALLVPLRLRVVSLGVGGSVGSVKIHAAVR